MPFWFTTDGSILNLKSQSSFSLLITHSLLGEMKLLSRRFEKINFSQSFGAYKTQ